MVKEKQDEKKISSKKSNKLLVQQQEMVLIHNSIEAQKTDLYGNLFDALSKYDKLSETAFWGDRAFDKKARAVILHEKKLLINNMIQEWTAIAISDEATEDVHCELCGHKNVFVCYIKNRYTGKELHVGTDCIKKFPVLENFRDVRRVYAKTQIERDKEKRRIEFSVFEGDDYNFTKSVEKQFENIEVLLPYELYFSIKQIIYDLNFVKTDYIARGGDFTETSEKYVQLKSDFLFEWSKAEKFYQMNMKNPLICHKMEADWIREKNSSIWEKIARNNGLYDKETLKYMYYDKFMNKHIKLFQDKLVDSDTRISNISGQSVEFTMMTQNFHHPIIFTLANKVFMERIGCFCLIDKNYHYSVRDFDIKEIKISHTLNNFHTILERISSIILEIGFTIEIDNDTNETFYKILPKVNSRANKERTKIEVSETRYIKVDKYCIADNIYKNMLFASDEVVKRNMTVVYNQLLRSKNWISQEVRDRYSSIAKDAAALQKQKEFCYCSHAIIRCCEKC